MGDRKMLIVLLVSCVSLVLSQDDMDARQLEELQGPQKRSIQDAVSKFKAIIEGYSNKKIPDFDGKSGKVKYKISEIDVSKVRVDLDPEISLFDGLKRAKLTFKLPTFVVHAKWWARYKTWLMRITRDGSMTATVKKASVTVVGSIDPANYVDPASSGSSFEPCHKIAINVTFLHEKNATSLCSHILSIKLQMMFAKVQDCSSKVDISLSIRGGGWIIKVASFFFKGSLVRKMEDKVEESICKAIKRL